MNPPCAKSVPAGFAHPVDCVLGPPGALPHVVEFGLARHHSHRRLRCGYRGIRIGVVANETGVRGRWSHADRFELEDASAYLTVSEIFPLEVRAKAIAVFFAIAQCFGALGPVIYGALIGDGSQSFPLFLGYLLGAAVMMVGGLVAWFLAVDAEGKSLEDIATPLAAAGARRRPGSVRAEGATPPYSP
jgi:hypothetical protein